MLSLRIPSQKPILTAVALWLFGFVTSPLSLGGCATIPSRPSTTTTIPFQLHNETHCTRFHDQRTGLRFCTPPQTTLRFLALDPDPFGTRFEAILQSPSSLVELRLRKDPLLAESTPEEALEASWLLRYGLSYAERRGAKPPEIRSHTLHPKRTAFLQADTAIWLSFPLRNPRFIREEVLILAQRPLTRYLISLRIASKAQSPEHFDDLAQFLRQFLQALRLKSPQDSERSR